MTWVIGHFVHTSVFLWVPHNYSLSVFNYYIIFSVGRRPCSSSCWFPRLPSNGSPDMVAHMQFWYMDHTDLEKDVCGDAAVGNVSGKKFTHLIIMIARSLHGMHPHCPKSTVSLQQEEIHHVSLCGLCWKIIDPGCALYEGTASVSFLSLSPQSSALGWTHTTIGNPWERPLK